MKAWKTSSYGHPKEVLSIVDVERPAPIKRQVLVKVMATSVNDYDWCAVSGQPFEYRLIFGIRKPRNPFLGMELAGVVESLGPEVQDLQVGDEVFGDVSEFKLGTFSAYTCVDERAFTKKPSFLSFADATSLAHAGMLSWQGFELGSLKEGERVLVNGAGGGVGSMALQLAKIKGCHVSGVDSGAKLERMLSKGFDRVYDYKSTDYTQLDEKFDFIIDCKTCYPPRMLYKALTKSGRYVSVGGKSRYIIGLILVNVLAKFFTSKKLMMLMLKPNKGMDELLSLCEQGKLKCEVDGPHAFDQVPEQISRFGKGLHLGKIVIEL